MMSPFCNRPSAPPLLGTVGFGETECGWSPFGARFLHAEVNATTLARTPIAKFLLGWLNVFPRKSEANPQNGPTTARSKAFERCLDVAARPKSGSTLPTEDISQQGLQPASHLRLVGNVLGAKDLGKGALLGNDLETVDIQNKERNNRKC